jgi:hypothetical protein
MFTQTTYLTSRGGRIHYFFWGLFFACSGLFILSAFFSDGARSQNHEWPVYVFAGSVIALWLGFAAYCIIRGLKLHARVVVDANGFSYEGLFQTLRFLWTEVTAADSVYDRGNFKWLAVTVNRTGKRTRRVKLDFSGLNPSRTEFVIQLRKLAPWVEVK